MGEANEVEIAAVVEGLRALVGRGRGFRAAGFVGSSIIPAFAFAFALGLAAMEFEDREDMEDIEFELDALWYEAPTLTLGERERPGRLGLRLCAAAGERVRLEGREGGEVDLWCGEEEEANPAFSSYSWSRRPSGCLSFRMHWKYCHTDNPVTAFGRLM